MNTFEWNEETPVTANNLNEMQNIINDNITTTVNDKNIITVGLSTYSSGVTTGSTVPFNIVKGQIGEELTLYNNQIVIGSGISKIKVSGNLGVRYNATNSKSYGFTIKKNSTTIMQTQTHKVITEPLSCSMAPIIVDVSFEDVIYMTTNFTASADVSELFTFLTIEAIA